MRRYRTTKEAARDPDACGFGRRPAIRHATQDWGFRPACVLETGGGQKAKHHLRHAQPHRAGDVGGEQRRWPLVRSGRVVDRRDSLRVFSGNAAAPPRTCARRTNAYARARTRSPKKRRRSGKALLSADARDLIATCLAPKPRDRPSLETIANHPTCRLGAPEWRLRPESRRRAGKRKAAPPTTTRPPRRPRKRAPRVRHAPRLCSRRENCRG